MLEWAMRKRTNQTEPVAEPQQAISPRTPLFLVEIGSTDTWKSRKSSATPDTSDLECGVSVHCASSAYAAKTIGRRHLWRKV